MFLELLRGGCGSREEGLPTSVQAVSRRHCDICRVLVKRIVFVQGAGVNWSAAEAGWWTGRSARRRATCFGRWGRTFARGANDKREFAPLAHSGAENGTSHIMRHIKQNSVACKWTVAPCGSKAPCAKLQLPHVRNDSHRCNRHRTPAVDQGQHHDAHGALRTMR